MFYNNGMDRWSGNYNGKQLRSSGRRLGISHQPNRTQSILLYACVLSPADSYSFFYYFRVKQVLDFQILPLSPADRSTAAAVVASVRSLWKSINKSQGCSRLETTENCHIFQIFPNQGLEHCACIEKPKHVLKDWFQRKNRPYALFQG